MEVLGCSFAGAGVMDGAVASFLLFLKLNFLGGSKVFLMVWSFSERDFMACFVCVSVSAPRTVFCSSCFVFGFILSFHRLRHSYLTICSLVIRRQVTGCVHDIVG